jgi:hypothetical protein
MRAIRQVVRSSLQFVAFGIDHSSLLKWRQCLTPPFIRDSPRELSGNYLSFPRVDMGTTCLPTRTAHDIRCTDRDDDGPARATY